MASVGAILVVQLFFAMEVLGLERPTLGKEEDA